ncbi:TBC1 domain family member 8-like [Sciurus carolinensis]|uniref:TBC1 domain family member 8-like n=1 Tax=Sciurus carolinensis TaxID=30640 RepID=UPI001FB452B9|nr:TBC1 domain family member 8-like [Sciurus carolinensis]XP_047393750.1 TBC1 domain family member 8-like [Sciurus carolinensis]XP_047393751.1 TBC1 domain family member 8-like [Sciurus carolinensis]XP_047393752.1 TBC1 domain family member 8-like [Sciurus carolinensis]XP_047393753.1 TBC1 domain family member 8-like [Sciurus carolinensis]
MRSGARCAGAKPDHQEATKKQKLHTVMDLLLWTPFSRFHTAGRMFSSDSSTCFASIEDDCYNVVLLLREVVSMEKMEDTSLLPSPVLISIRSKMAFQFIELKDRETLEETLLERLKQVHANHPVHYDTSTNDKDMGWTHITCFVLDKQVQ